MSKVDVYVAEYTTIDKVTKEESELLASSECVVGMSVQLSQDPDSNGFRVSTKDGRSLGLIHPRARLGLTEAFENGWPLHCWLSLVYYVQKGGEKLFHGEVVYQFYNVKPTQTAELASLQAYSDKIHHLLAAGKRPRVSLTGSEYEEVLSQGGSFTPTGVEALPFAKQHNSGVVVYKKKQSLADQLTQMALAHRGGCLAGSIGVLALIVLVIALVIWLIFFR